MTSGRAQGLWKKMMPGVYSFFQPVPFFFFVVEFFFCILRHLGPGHCGTLLEVQFKIHPLHRFLVLLRQLWLFS